jgi:hypothetical protein
VAVDDYGEGLDAAATQHLAATLRRAANQVWLSTRRPHAAEAFSPEEVVRLTRDAGGHRRVFYGRIPKTKSERLAARHWSLQLLPALTSGAVIVMEGPHDRAALTALAGRLSDEEGVPLPAGSRVVLIDAGTLGGSGGSSAVPALASAARELGLGTVAVIDHDRGEKDAQDALEANLASADVVVRLPKGHAIELALLAGLDDQVIRTALQELCDAFAVPVPADLVTLSGRGLRKAAREMMKHRGGFHAQFVQTLPPGCYPTLARRVLEEAIDQAVKVTKGQAAKGLVQLEL